MSFKLAIAAICTHQAELLENILEDMPALLTARDPDNRKTLMHYAAAFGGIEVNKIILHHLKMLNQLKILTYLDNHSNTVLHSAAAFNTAEVVEIFINMLGKKAASYMLKTCNKNGSIPLLLNDDRPDEVEKNKVRHILLPLTLNCAIKPLNTLLKLDDILKQYPTKDPRLQENLHWAVLAANEARKNILQSNTHPEINSKSEDEKKVVSEEIISMRNECDYALSRLTKKQSAGIELEEQSSIIKRYKKGNCQDFGKLVTNFLRKSNKRVEMCLITGDDHVVVLFDHDKKSKLNEHATLGPHAVICDAWAGKVYPANRKTILSELMAYYPVFYGATSYYNVLAYFNPICHGLKAIYSVEPRATAVTPVRASLQTAEKEEEKTRSLSTPQTFFSRRALKVSATHVQKKEAPLRRSLIKAKKRNVSRLFTPPSQRRPVMTRKKTFVPKPPS